MNAGCFYRGSTWENLPISLSVRWGLKLAREVLARVQEMSIQLVEASAQAVLEAAHIKANYPIAYADAFAAVVALSENVVVITGYLEFKEVRGIGAG